MTLNLVPTWQTLLKEELASPKMKELFQFLNADAKINVCYPPPAETFTAFNLTPPETIKTIVLGQDVYHGAGQAHGLAFSVQPGVTIPPSLRNIYQEITADTGETPLPNGSLIPWAEQGVFLLNRILTVRAKQPLSHANRGWEEFTGAVIRKISDNSTGLVFLLWGRPAKAVEPLIDASKHLILTAAHPSPFSAHNGFFGCKHFSKTNEWLVKQGKAPIVWGRGSLNDKAA